MTAILSMAGVRRAWKDRVVLRDVDLDLDPGEVVALVGANGAGKTTLVRVAAGAIAPDAGKVSLEGLDPLEDRRDYQKRMGYLPAGDRGLYPRLTTAQNMRLWAAMSFVPAAEEDAALARARQRFALDDLWGSRVDRMSLGQRQRVRLGMTFVHEPDVVLLDEPHTSLDDAGIERLQTALGDLKERGGAAIWCAPNATRVDLASDRVVVLDNGRLGPG